MLLLITFAIVSVFFTYWILSRIKILKTFENLGIPGPKPNVIFGNLYEIYKKGPLKCHEEWQKKYGDIVGYYNGMNPVILICDPETLKQVQIRDFNKFVDRGAKIMAIDESAKFRDMLHSTGKKWKETRSLLAPAFSSGKLKQLSTAMVDATDTMVELVKSKVEQGEAFDIYPIWQSLTVDIIGRTALGIESNVQLYTDHPLVSSCKVIFSVIEQNSLLYLIIFSFKAFGKLFMLIIAILRIVENNFRNPVRHLFSGLLSVIEERKTNVTKRRPDLLQSLIDAEQDETDNNSDQLNGEVDPAGTSKTQNSTDLKPNSNTRKRILTIKEIVENALLFLLAGYETSSTTLGFLTYVLVNYPDIQEKLREELRELIRRDVSRNISSSKDFLETRGVMEKCVMGNQGYRQFKCEHRRGELSCDSLQNLKYLDNVIMETLRMYPPASFVINRIAVEDASVGCYFCPKGMVIQVPVNWIHHNPEFWDNPQEFQPSRFDDPETTKKLSWQAFGAGPRNCIGKRFALMEIKMAISKLLLNYRLQPCEKTEKGSPQLSLGFVILAPRNGVHVKVVPLDS